MGIPPTQAHRLEVRHLSKSYGDFEAVKDSSFTLEPGSMTGFLGANGAGKTTTMRMLMGLLEPSSGQILYQGKPLTSEGRRNFGYMPEERGLYPKQPILDQLVYLSQLRGISASIARERATGYLSQLGLGDRLKAKLESLSLGNQQRVQIVAAILHDPSVLILDEPFSGLDPTALDTMIGILNGFRQKGVPVLFSSHQLDLVDRLCDRVVIIGQGEVKASGTAQELREAGTPTFLYKASEDAGWLRQIPGIQVLDINGNQGLFELSENADLEVVRSQILKLGIDRGMQEFSRQLPTLGDIYRKATNQ